MLIKWYGGHTCSFGMLATAYGLLGCTFGEVTEGHPFCNRYDEYQSALKRGIHTSSQYIFFPFPCCMNQSRFLSMTMGHEAFAKVRAINNHRVCAKSLRKRTRRRVLVEEREHVDVDEVDSVQDVLGTPSLLVSVRKLTHSHGYIQAREIRLRKNDLFSKFLMGKDVVIEGFRSKLHSAGDEFCFGVCVQRSKEGVTAGDPNVAPIEPELWKWYQYDLRGQTT